MNTRFILLSVIAALLLGPMARPSSAVESPAISNTATASDAAAISNTTVSISNTGAISNAPAAIAENPFAAPISNILAFFKPLKGDVVSSEGGAITASITNAADAHEGMRVHLLRPGAAFIHPITLQPIGQAETPVGVAEVISVAEGSLSLSLKSGETRAGDIARIPSARIRTLFYQMKDVDWDVGEEYYYWLKDSGRFALSEVEPGTASLDEIAVLAREKQCEAVIVLTKTGTAAEIRLRHLALWAHDAKVFTEQEFAIDPSALASFKVGQEFFAPPKNKPIATLKMPYSASLIAAGDLDADGSTDIVIASGSGLYFYSLSGMKLKPAFGSREEVSLDRSNFDNYIWIELFDIDSDGSDEIVASFIRGDTARSAVFKRSASGQFDALWEGEGFVRVVEGALYRQAGHPDGGFTGSIELVANAPGGRVPAQPISPPEGMDLYNFSTLRMPGKGLVFVSFDRKGRLTVVDSSGGEAWKAEGFYGGFTRVFKRNVLPGFDEPGTWHMNDRIMKKRNAALTFQRKPVNEKIQGAGYNKSRLMGVYATAAGVREVMLVDEMKGSSMDFADHNGKLYVLAGSFGMNPANILKGKQLFSSRVVVYSFSGE